MRIEIDTSANVTEVARELEAEGMVCVPLFERDEQGKITGAVLIAEPVFAVAVAA